MKKSNSLLADLSFSLSIKTSYLLNAIYRKHPVYTDGAPFYIEASQKRVENYLTKNPNTSSEVELIRNDVFRGFHVPFFGSCCVPIL